MRSISLSKLALTPDISRPSANTSAVASTATANRRRLHCSSRSPSSRIMPAPPPSRPTARSASSAYRATCLRLPFIGTDGPRHDRPPVPAQPAHGVLAEQDRRRRSSRVAVSIRAAVLTASPMTVKSRRPPPPTLPAMTVPESMPMPISRSPWNVSAAAPAIAAAASSARSAWSGWWAGAPNTASSPSPTNLSTWPSRSAMIGTTSSNRQLSVSTTSPGSNCSAKAVKSLMSTNIIVTSTSRARRPGPSRRMCSAISRSR